MIDGYNNNRLNEINDNLKIFKGKLQEIKAIERNGRVISRKIYLAYDTGEIYIGNEMRRLEKYGGSNKTLSKDEVKALIETCTKNDLDLIRRQLTASLSNYQAMSQRATLVEKSITDALEELNNNTLNYIQKKVSEVLLTASDITYSKQDIDSKISNVNNMIQTSYVSNSQLANNLNSYISNDYMRDNMIQYATGDSLIGKKANSETGIFMCVSDSSDPSLSYEQGHIYSLSGGNSSDIGGIGSGPSGSSSPSISLTVNDLSYINIKFGDSYSVTDGSIKFNVENSKMIYGTLSLYLDSNLLRSNIMPTQQTFSQSFSLTTPTVGVHSLKLSGVDRSQNAIQGTFDINVIAPLYIGCGLNVLTSDTEVKDLTEKLTTDVCGDYNISVSDGKYIWICIPKSFSNSNFTSGGFKVPFNAPIEKIVSNGTISCTYNCYRSSNSFMAGTYTIKIS